MSVKQVEQIVSPSLSTIKAMAAETGPCVSILLSFEPEGDQVTQNGILWKHAIEQADQALAAKGVESRKRAAMIENLRMVAEGLPKDMQGAAVYCSVDGCHAFRIPRSPVGEQVMVGDRFDIKPLVPMLHMDRVFYVLALSQKHARLLRCTDQAAEEVALPEAVPTSLREDSDTEKPDHKEASYSSGGPDQGGMRGVMSSTNNDSERRMAYLAHFYKHVSEGVAALLKEEKAPLVIAGVDYEIAAFRRVNTYSNLVADAVHGAADGLKGGELHRRALEAMKSHDGIPLKAALARYEQMAGSARGSVRVKDIVKAAFEGRVLDLILAEGAQYLGSFRERDERVSGQGDEDLLNEAAIQTILHAGSVFVVAPSQVPHGAQAVAVFRY
jgi:hypothetical protein